MMAPAAPELPTDLAALRALAESPIVRPSVRVAARQALRDARKARERAAAAEREARVALLREELTE